MHNGPLNTSGQYLLRMQLQHLGVFMCHRLLLPGTFGGQQLTQLAPGCQKASLLL